MLVYIHTHDADELSLKDIADAGTMSIAQCNRCFNSISIAEGNKSFKGCHVECNGNI